MPVWKVTHPTPTSPGAPQRRSVGGSSCPTPDPLRTVFLETATVAEPLPVPLWGSHISNPKSPPASAQNPGWNLLLPALDTHPTHTPFLGHGL